MTTAQTIATALEANQMSARSNDLSQKRLWTGGIPTGLSAAFCILDGIMKLLRPPQVVQATMQLGTPSRQLSPSASSCLSARCCT